MILFFVLTTVSARAAKIEIECPEEIKTKQSVSTVPKGWSAHVDTLTTRQIFTGLTLFNGHPKDAAPLFPDEAEKNEKITDAPDTVYKIPPGHDVYVACLYTGTLVQMVRKLPKDVQICRVRFSETLGHVQKAVCE